MRTRRPNANFEDVKYTNTFHISLHAWGIKGKIHVPDQVYFWPLLILHHQASSWMMDKTKLRGGYLLQRAMLDQEDKKNWSAQVCELLGNLVEEMQPKIIHTFIPLESEVDITSLIRDWIAGSPTVVVPRTLSDRKMDHWLLTDWGQLVFGRFETQHPEGTDQFFGEADLIIIPGLAYDKSGTRLGYGAGYYDTFLAQSKGLKVAVGFPFQITETPLPKEVHDIPMDVIITDHMHRV